MARYNFCCLYLALPLLKCAHEPRTRQRLPVSVLSARNVVRDLILGFVPDEWLHSLDYSTLERVDGSYITEDFRNRWMSYRR